MALTKDFSETVRARAARDPQTAAPPAVPPRRPIVGAAMADDHEGWYRDLARDTAARLDQCNASIAALRDNLERLRAIARRLDRNPEA